ncbi:hypothetical protein AVEN_51208-1, partial [Araneus ventricosus]
DGASPHWNIHFRRYLNDELPHRWIERVGEDDLTFYPWPPRSPDLTPCDFLLWELTKDIVFVPPLPKALKELMKTLKQPMKTLKELMKTLKEFMKALKELMKTLKELCLGDHRQDEATKCVEQIRLPVGMCRVTQGLT